MNRENAWYHFNDEVVEKLDNPAYKCYPVGDSTNKNEQDPNPRNEDAMQEDESSQTILTTKEVSPNPRNENATEQDELPSKTAYMLFYAQSLDSPTLSREACNVAEHDVIIENTVFASELERSEARRQELQAEFQRHQTLRRQVKEAWALSSFEVLVCVTCV